ncbi:MULTISPECIES: hypothetical protein [Cellulomonas]|nr:MULTISPECIES: hypothetical protein [Cellulomonas]
MSDLESLSGSDHFAAEPARHGMLGVTSRVCVTVRVDNIERMPMWLQGM